MARLDACHGELLIGDRGGRPALLESYDKLVRVPSIAHGEVVELVRSRKLHGRGVGWIDVHLLASTLVAGTVLWTTSMAGVLHSREIGMRSLCL